MLDLARGQQLADHGLDGVRGDGEADPNVAVAGAAGLDLRVDPDHLAARVEQRAPAVAVVDRRIGLDHVVDRVPVRRPDVPLEGADDAGRDRSLEAERVADRDDRVADFESSRVGQGKWCERAGTGIDLEQCEVGGRVAADEGCLQRVVVREAHLDRGCSVDDVKVGDDVPLLVQHETRAERLRRLLELAGRGGR